MRPLYDDGASSATAATRDYVLEVGDADGRAPAADVFGGKITTHRRLAEAAMAKLAPLFPGLPGAWTAGAPLPGGDFPWNGARRRSPAGSCAAHPFLDAGAGGAAGAALRHRGRPAMLEGARTAADLGEDFGAGPDRARAVWLREREWARTAEDVLWRRTKLGLRLDAAQAARVDAFMRGEAAEAAAFGVAAAPR